ncbi:hypothetical protein GGS23DRAFT_168629 [Durotheca rogersii]|uniref:uncharacterized protein n=1 Tax=Durotheca rogersii TaxID=419775 RepID=UPI002220010E|nr:uncharacterized protein GGS23DRAFT_168629 [Durotheca rogersii]KAI5867277.1 hypothetical protein GGS23DRAFT_168629 [Durotheca rogersii]
MRWTGVCGCADASRRRWVRLGSFRMRARRSPSREFCQAPRASPHQPPRYLVRRSSCASPACPESQRGWRYFALPTWDGMLPTCVDVVYERTRKTTDATRITSGILVRVRLVVIRLETYRGALLAVRISSGGLPIISRPSAPVYPDSWLEGWLGVPRNLSTGRL